MYLKKMNFVYILLHFVKLGFGTKAFLKFRDRDLLEDNLNVVHTRQDV